ncbi:uncharacterized protein LOC133744246 [Rosa rugosa]|uniref:uncharacterized protein LOC133744246 n=1 Tax=Rosa rugosa TaxID=74645 RepID=UPI002B40527E|nr:uncharacterized protein LOC133744246 [Rosa rugosa]
MAGYPYHSPPPPPSPPCNSTTSPILPPPPPPPPPSPPCNTTTTPKLQPPPPPACTCNNLPPPTLPSPPPPSHYYPPIHSPPPPSPSHPSPLSPPPPPFNYSPPVLPPPSSPSPPPASPPSSYFPSPQPTPSPPSPDYSPPPPSQSPSPWAIPPNHYNSISPNYYDSIAPGPQFSSPSNGQRTAIVTTFVSLGGVFFVAFIVIGLLSMAMKKRMSRNGTGQLGSSEDRHNLESNPAGKPTDYSDIENGPDPDTNLVESSKVQTAPPDQRIVQQAQDLQTSISSGANNTSADPNVGQDSFNDNQGKVDGSDTIESSKPSGEQSVPDEDAGEGKLDEGNSKPHDDHTDASPDVEKESNAVEEESNESKKKPRLPKNKKSQRKSGAKKGKENPSGILQFAKAADIIGAEELEDGDNDEDEVPESNPEDDGDEKVEHSNADEQEPDERHGEPLSHQSETKNNDSAQHVEEESNAAEQESKDSKSKLSLPKKERSPSTNGVNKGKEKPSSSSGAKKGKENPSGILQFAKAADIIGAEELEDGDNDGDQVPESNPEDDGDEKVEHSNADEQEPDEHRGEPLSHQIETKNTDSAQHVDEDPNAAEQESKDSKKKPSLSSGAKKGKENPSGILQFAKAADIIGAEELEDGDNDEDQVPELNPKHDGEELISGGSNNADEKVEHSNADEQEPDERHGEPLSHQIETKNTDSAQHVEEESNAAEQESKDSKSKLSLPKKERSPSTSGVNKGKEKPSSNSGAKRGKENLTGILQFAKAADIIGAEELEDGDNDEDHVLESNPEVRLISGGSNNADEKVEHSNANEQEPNESLGEPLFNHQSETKNTDSAQYVKEESNAAEQEPKDSKSKLSMPKKERSPSTSGVKKRKEKPSWNSGTKMGKENPSGILQFAKATDIFSLDEAEELKDGDNDEEQAPESNPEDNGEELISSGLNHADENVEHSIADEKEPDDCHGEPLCHQSETKNTDSAQHVEEESNAVEEESNECSHKPLSNQSETKNTDVTQDVDKVHAAEKDSNDSKRNLRPPKKDKASSSRRHPQGKLQHSRFDQVLNATDNICQHGGVQSQEDDNDEAEVHELGSHNDGEEFDLSGSNNVDEGVERQSNEHEEESDERHCKPLINQSESDNIEATQYQEKEPYEGEKKPYGLEEKSYESEKRSLQMKNPSGHRSGKQKPFKFGEALNITSNVDLDGAIKSQEDDDRKAEVQESKPQEDGGDLNLGGPNNANEDVELPSKVDEEISNEPLCNKIETGDIEVTQDVEQQSDEKQKLINSKETFFQKKKHSSHLTRKQKASIVGQVSDVVSNFDLDGAMQSQDIDADEVEVHESESQNHFEKLEVASSKKDQRGQQAHTRARSREEPLNLERLISTASGTDSSRAMVSLVDEEGKVEELNPFASARGGKQALSKATVPPDLIQITATNVDDSSEELKSVGADNYKDNKAKAHEVKFGGSKKDLRGRQHHTQEQEELKLFNLEKVVTTASSSDSGKALVSFDDEDEKIQESELIASNVDSYFQQPLSSAQGIDQNVELTSLGDGDYKDRKAEVYQLSKDSRKIKGHTMGARTRIEPPNLDQIVTARIGGDLGDGLESLGGNHEGESDKDGSNKDLPGSGQTSRGTQQLPNLVQILTATNEGDPNPELKFCEDDKELELEYSMRDLSLQEPSPDEIEPSTDDQSVFATVDDDPDVVQFHYNEYDEEPAESNKDGRTGKPLSRPPTTSLRGKRRA